MKIKLDENVSQDLVVPLERLGHDVHTVRSEGLVGRSDRQVWQAAQQESRFFITQDLDFSDIRKFGLHSHHGILLLRLHSPSRQKLIDRVLDLFQAQHPESWIACLVVATERKIRLLKPPVH
jgi:predicted nuclease of predicted toxin-antitoxin system